MNKFPVTVQQWVDTVLPPQRSPNAARSNMKKKKFLTRDLSMQSDDASSMCSSVESVLELRKPDPEEVLLGLGFGPPTSASSVSRIPQRFLQPSKVILFLIFGNVHTFFCVIL